MMKALDVLRDMDVSEFQALLNYTSSRTRAAAYHCACRLDSLSAPEKQTIIRVLQSEVMAGNFIMGVGVTFYENRLIVPTALRGITKLVLLEFIPNPEAFLAVVGDTKDGTRDAILPRYVGDWWTKWDPKKPAESLSLEDVVAIWESQVIKHPIVQTRSDFEVNIAALPKPELQKAHSVAQDAMVFIDAELEANFNQLLAISENIVKREALREDLDKLAKRLVDNEVSELPL
ncbi:hypothetical protein DFP72DRAFT_1068324 [Ephemerocybe angulata]|uniref:Uncharacterized protein n=1 Tax=Ephemerocybe angulata TaxID=980116 RepID=A0A8H6M4V0_9AGAR|nr:hypothetical protein DFP72DRAFT_1068324 [Tulosesus angulatus]